MMEEGPLDSRRLRAQAKERTADSRLGLAGKDFFWATAELVSTAWEFLMKQELVLADIENAYFAMAVVDAA